MTFLARQGIPFDQFRAQRHPASIVKEARIAALRVSINARQRLRASPPNVLATLRRDEAFSPGGRSYIGKVALKSSGIAELPERLGVADVADRRIPRRA
jgi:hypothetical protein